MTGFVSITETTFVTINSKIKIKINCIIQNYELPTFFKCRP